MDRSRLQGAAAGRRIGRDGRAGVPAGRVEARGSGEHRDGPQHDRLHALLLLPAGAAGPSAGLVQDPRLSLAGGEGAAQGSLRVRRRTAGRRPGPRARFHRRHAVPGASAPARRNRDLVRGGSRRHRDARQHGRGGVCRHVRVCRTTPARRGRARCAPGRAESPQRTTIGRPPSWPRPVHAIPSGSVRRTLDSGRGVQRAGAMRRTRFHTRAGPRRDAEPVRRPPDVRGIRCGSRSCRSDRPRASRGRHPAPRRTRLRGR